MQGLLIYDSEGFARNQWFANELIAVARKYGIDLQLLIVNEFADCQATKTPDFVIVRTINPAVNEYFERLNVRVFNNYKTSYYANNKWLTYLLAKQNGIATMNTYMPEREGERGGISYPFVLKTLNGHGGKEVFKVTSENEYAHLAKKYQNNYLIQEFCSNAGKDVRVYCLGGEIVVAILRTGASDFRSNFSLGGSVSVFEPTPTMRKVAQTLSNVLQFDFVGVDFIYHKGEWVLNEIEDVVGTRMVYERTNIDMVDEYMKYIKKTVAE